MQLSVACVIARGGEVVGSEGQRCPADDPLGVARHFREGVAGRFPVGDRRAQDLPAPCRVGPVAAEHIARDTSIRRRGGEPGLAPAPPQQAGQAGAGALTDASSIAKDRPRGAADPLARPHGKAVRGGEIIRVAPTPDSGFDGLQALGKAFGAISAAAVGAAW